MANTTSEQKGIDPYQSLRLIKGQRLKLTSSNPFVPTYVQSSITQSNPSGIYNSRIQGRMFMLSNPMRESRVKQEKMQKTVKKAVEKDKKTLGLIGRREAHEKGVWKLKNEQTKYDLFLPLHRLWLGYMSELLALDSPPIAGPSTTSSPKIPSSAALHAKLVKADFHGSIMTVRQSKNPCLVGLTGIVIHESENAFKIVTKKNKIKLLPKQNSIFAFAVPLYSVLGESKALVHPTEGIDNLMPTAGVPKTILEEPHIEFELYGNQFCFRSADRSNRKFKSKETIEL